VRDLGVMPLPVRCYSGAAQRSASLVSLAVSFICMWYLKSVGGGSRDGAGKGESRPVPRETGKRRAGRI